MAVRAFNGSSDLINTATGGLAAGTFGTQAVIVKRVATGAWHTFLALHNSGGSALTQFAYQNTDLAAWWIDGITVTGPSAIVTSDWGLVVVRKASGTATPRFSLYNFTAQTWTHANASGSRPNWSAPGASGTVRVEWQGFDRLNGRLAVRAAWNSLPWNANAGGDNALESAGLETSLQAWVDASPDALWAFNQASTATPVEDLTGGGADQTSISGTAVVTDDDPPGFAFESGGIAVGRVTGTGTARVLTASKVMAISRVVAIGSARAFGSAKTRALGRITETGQPRALDGDKARELGRVTEVGTARAFGAAKARQVGRITATGTVRSFTLEGDTSIGRVIGTGVVRPLTAGKMIQLGRVTETGDVRQLVRVLTFGRVVEGGTVRTLTSAKVKPFARVSEMGAVRGLLANQVTVIVTAQGRYVPVATAAGRLALVAAAAGLHDPVASAAGRLAVVAIVAGLHDLIVDVEGTL